jgi:MoaA/NifB/PqqE/SkfB family radical SAM enzyme
MSESYCPLPWLGLNVLPDGIINPCCQWSGEYKKVDLQNIKRSDITSMFDEIRHDMILGKEIKGCFQCKSAEQAGAISRRQEALKQYGIVNTVKTKVLDINFDNVCNLKCRGCCSSSSHLWFNDELEIYGKTFADKKYRENYLNIEYDDLEVLNISGGEPFLSKEFNNLSSKLLEKNIANNLQLIISTNGTILPSENIFRLFKEVKQLNLNISIDGIGYLNQYFRSGAEFNICLNTLNYLKILKELRKNKVTKLNVHTTVSIYNVNLLGEIKSFFETHFPEFSYSHRILYWPEQLCIRYMPSDLKKLVRPYVIDLGNDYIDVINELDTDAEDYFNHFLNFHHTLDRIRLENLRDANKLLSDYISNKNTKINSKTFFVKQMNLLKCGM